MSSTKYLKNPYELLNRHKAHQIIAGSLKNDQKYLIFQNKYAQTPVSHQPNNPFIYNFN